jgi:hypothetical protein
MKEENLKKKFAEAGLELQVRMSPLVLGRGTEGIVQVDIAREFKGNRRKEWFRIYLGAEGNEVDVRGVDKASKQLVLTVKEPEREFDELVRIPKKNNAAFRLEELRKIKLLWPKPVRAVLVADGIFVTRKTDPAVRYFLAGVDERCLFIAQLTGSATTVAQARSLLGKTVEFAEGDQRRGSSLDRQGEWFFLKVSDEVAREVDEAVRKTRTTIRKGASIGAAVTGRQIARVPGNPHMADELVTMPAIPLVHGHSVAGRPRVFVRGAVRHKDHRTVRFDGWREVVANSEQRATSGVYWID